MFSRSQCCAQKTLNTPLFTNVYPLNSTPRRKNTTAATWALRACWEAPCAETETWGLGNGPRLRELGDAFGYPDYSMMISVFLSHLSHLSHLSSVFLLCFPPKLVLARLNWDILAAAEHGDLQGSGIDQKYGDPFCYNKDIGSLDDMGMVHHWKDQRMMLKWCLWSQWWFEEMTTWRPWLSRRPWTPWRYSGQLFLLPSTRRNGTWNNSGNGKDHFSMGKSSSGTWFTPSTHPKWVVSRISMTNFWSGLKLIVIKWVPPISNMTNLR